MHVAEYIDKLMHYPLKCRECVEKRFICGIVSFSVIIVHRDLANAYNNN